MYDSREDCNAIIETKTNTLIAGCMNSVIPNSVTSIGSDAFFGCEGLTSIEIPNSVTNIGLEAFSDCTGLTSIEIPNSVTNIGDAAFSGCTGLTSIEIPNSVTDIGDEAFADCTGLTSIEIPNSVTNIEFKAFYGCTGLTSIEIPNSVTSIRCFAFFGCTGLTSIEIPNSVTNIEIQAFSGCTGLTSIEIPNSVTNIEWQAFRGCTGLTSIEIPNSVTSIKSNAFENCKFKKLCIPDKTKIDGCSLCRCFELEYISTKDSAYYTNLDGVLYTKDLKALVKMPCGRKGEFISSPETEIICFGAFCQSQLHTVKLSNKIKEIGEKAFSESSLQELHIQQERPEEIVVGEKAFRGLDNCTLYVPIGTGYAYRHHPAFKGMFKEVIIERIKE